MILTFANINQCRLSTISYHIYFSFGNHVYFFTRKWAYAESSAFLLQLEEIGCWIALNASVGLWWQWFIGSNVQRLVSSVQRRQFWPERQEAWKSAQEGWGLLWDVETWRNCQCPPLPPTTDQIAACSTRKKSQIINKDIQYSIRMMAIIIQYLLLNQGDVPSFSYQAACAYSPVIKHFICLITVSTGTSKTLPSFSLSALCCSTCSIFCSMTSLIILSMGCGSFARGPQTQGR